MADRFLRRGLQQDSRGEVSTADKVLSASPDIPKLMCVFVLAMLLLLADLHAQTSMVIGTITYQNGKPAVNVLVSIGGRYRYTDVGGRYKIDEVPQGRQHMTIKSGQRILWQLVVDISGTTTTVNQVIP